MEYQEKFTSNPVAKASMYDVQGRHNRAYKVLTVLEDYFGPLESYHLLDVSCSTGLMAEIFSRKLKHVTGIDIDKQAVTYAKNNCEATNAEFLVMDALHTDFPENHFDIVVCNQMYEHVPDAQALFDEIFRILKPGGICYFGATNRLNIIETHYGRIPFLSYLPKPLAHRYLRLLGRGQYYYETFYTYWGLRRLVRAFNLIDYTEKIIAAPRKFKADGMIKPGSFKQRIALVVLRTTYWATPGYVWLLQKPGGACIDTGD